MTSAITNPAPVETVKPALKKKIAIKEYVKSFLFLTAIYSLIINQVQHDKTDNRSTIKKMNYQQGNITEKKPGKQDLLFSLFYSGTSIILYPSHAWK
jgi:hypothetical protein